jgi:hypothetical protein
MVMHEAVVVQVVGRPRSQELLEGGRRPERLGGPPVTMHQTVIEFCFFFRHHLGLQLLEGLGELFTIRSSLHAGNSTAARNAVAGFTKRIPRL